MSEIILNGHKPQINEKKQKKNKKKKTYGIITLDHHWAYDGLSC